MNNEILCTILAIKIDPAKFQLWGLDVHWLSKPTKEELAIVDDVIKNYDTFEAEYLDEQVREQEIQDEIEKIKEVENLSYRTKAIANIKARKEVN